MNKILTKVIIAVFAAIILSLSISAASEPIMIYTTDDFFAMNDDLSGNYVLANSLNFDGVTFTPIGSTALPFTGTFDGAGFTLENISISVNSAEDAYAAVFTMLDGATVTDVIFDSCTVQISAADNAYAAVVCALNNGYIDSVEVANSTVTATSDFFAARVAAITAYNLLGGEINACTSSDTVITAESTHLYSDAAGIAAVNVGSITSSFNTGDIFTTSKPSDAVAAGIVATNYGLIADSENYGDITVTTVNGKAIGDGVTGNEAGETQNSTSSGKVTINSEAEDDILYGDVDADGVITPTDNVVLSRYLAKWTGYDVIDFDASDVDLDGEITAGDNVILSRFTAKWTGYETLPYVE